MNQHISLHVYKILLKQPIHVHGSFFLNNMGAVMKIEPMINIRESGGQQEEKEDEEEI